MRIAYTMLLQLCYSAVQFVGPLMLNQIIQILTSADIARQQGGEYPSSEITKAYLFAMGMFLAPVVGTLGASQANRVAIGTQIMIRTELIAVHCGCQFVVRASDEDWHRPDHLELGVELDVLSVAGCPEV